MNLFIYWVDTEHPQHAFFFVAAVTTGVDADGGELAALTPALDGEGGNAQERGDLGDGEQVGKIGKINFFFSVVVHI